MRLVRFLPAVLILAALAGGCSLFEPSAEVLAYETLLQSNAAVTRTQTEQGDRLPYTVVVRSEAEAAAFVEVYGLAVPLPAVDYDAQSVVGVVGQPGDATAAVTIIRIELRGHALDMQAHYDGEVRPGTDGPIPVHLVVTPRLTPRLLYPVGVAFTYGPVAGR